MSLPSKVVIIQQCSLIIYTTVSCDRAFWLDGSHCLSADIQYVWCGCRQHHTPSSSITMVWVLCRVLSRCFYAKCFLGVAESETALRSKGLCPAPAHSVFFFFSILQEKFGEPANQDSQKLFGLISQFVHDFRRAHAEVIWGVQPVLRCVHVGSLRDNKKTCQPKPIEKAPIVDKFIKCFRNFFAAVCIFPSVLFLYRCFQVGTGCSSLQNKYNVKCWWR